MQIVLLYVPKTTYFLPYSKPGLLCSSWDFDPRLACILEGVTWKIPSDYAILYFLDSTSRLKLAPTLHVKRFIFILRNVANMETPGL